MHPAVARGAEPASVALARSDGPPVALVDVPLLFETGGDAPSICVVVRERDARRPARPGAGRTRR